MAEEMDRSCILANIGVNKATNRSILTLLDARQNHRYRIVKIIGDGKDKRRLLDMGFTPNAQVLCHQIAPFGGTILVGLRGFMVAMREDAAKLIEVVDLGRVVI